MRFTACLFACLLGLACKTVYVPNALNVPLLSEKHEVRASINTNNLHVAYAATDHVGVMANAYHEDSESDPTQSSGQDGRGTLVEAGAGYFRPVARLLLFETYAGGGFGRLAHDNWETVNDQRRDYKYSLKAAKAFVQASLGITRRWFDAALSTRFVAMRAFDLKSVNYPPERLKEDDLHALDARPWIFIEPAITLRAGYKWIKLFGQFGHSFKLNDQPIRRRVTFLYVGLHIDIAPRWRL